MGKRIVAKNVLLMKFYPKMKIIIEKLVNSKKHSNFVSTVPVLHTIRTASGSFFLYAYVE